MPHAIRLRHPWQCRACDGGARWQRTFNWPAGLIAGESARLVIEGLPPTATVEFNDQSIVEGPAGHFDITPTLARYNRLAIQIASAESSDQTECPYDVRLEIVES